MENVCNALDRILLAGYSHRNRRMRRRAGQTFRFVVAERLPHRLPGRRTPGKVWLRLRHIARPRRTRRRAFHCGIQPRGAIRVVRPLRLFPPEAAGRSGISCSACSAEKIRARFPDRNEKRGAKSAIFYAVKREERGIKNRARDLKTAGARLSCPFL